MSSARQHSALEGDRSVDREHCPAQGRTWKDGRVLNSAQRDRKRAVDRARSKRDRHRQRCLVAALEAQVCELQASWTATSLVNGTLVLNDSGTAEGSDQLSGPTSPGRLNPADSIDRSLQIRESRQTSCQEIFNSVLHEACCLTPAQVCVDEEANQDAIIRGVTQGWPSIRARHQCPCPLWRILRLLDCRIFRHSGVITRFCTLSMIHRMLLALAGVADVKSLPQWYRPRPTQKALPHPLAVDILPWPGLRERAVLNLTLTASDKFWNDVIYCFRFTWPYDVSDATSVNPSSNLLRFTGLYKTYVEEISMWAMDPTFFYAFPDTADDILPALRMEWPLHVGEGGREGLEARTSKTLPLPIIDESADEADQDYPAQGTHGRTENISLFTEENSHSI